MTATQIHARKLSNGMDYSLRSLSTNQTEWGMTQFLWQWFVGWHAAKEQRPQLGRANVTEQQEHLHSPGSTFKISTGKEKQLCTVAAARGSQSHSDVKTQLLIVLGAGVNHTN